MTLILKCRKSEGMRQGCGISQEADGVGHKTEVCFVRSYIRSPCNTKVCRDILTRGSFLNAIVIVNILGGSTNAVRHIIHLYPGILPAN